MGQSLKVGTEGSTSKRKPLRCHDTLASTEGDHCQGACQPDLSFMSQIKTCRYYHKRYLSSTYMLNSSYNCDKIRVLSK